MEIERILSELIRIPSVNPPGGETAVAEYLKKLFDAAGIGSEIIESAPGRGSFIASLGSGRRSLLFLSHADVVPTGEGWDFDPFCGEIRDGLVLGRGAVDCKGLVAAEAWAMLQLHKLRLGGRLIFAATADEEAGGAYGVRFLIDKYPAKLQADFAINEGGEEPTRIGGRLTCFVQAGEKGPAWTHLKFSGVSCHGAVPTLGDNAITKAARAVARLGDYRTDVNILPTMKALLDTIARQQGYGRVNKENLDAILDSLPDHPFAETLRSLTRMTVSPNLIQGGTKTNIVPDKCEVDVDVRVLPGQDREYLLSVLRPLVGEEADISIPDFSPASASPTDTPTYGLIEQTMKEVIGDVDCVPMMSAGATDSRYLRLAGIPAYGPSVSDPGSDPAIRRHYHARNERIDIGSVKRKADFLVKLALTYLGER